MNYKKIIISSLVIVGGIFVLIFLLEKKDNDFEDVRVDSLLPEKIKIAACPTCFEVAKKLDKEKYQLVPTATTAESAGLLAKGEVDMILAGRTLYSGEVVTDSFVLRDGYSFLASRGMNIYADDLKNAIIYTDIELTDLSQKLPGFVFEKVDDVYDYLEEGVVVTTWENTDYNRAQIVHVIERDGQRLAMSRQPTLYCPGSCDEEIAIDIKSAFD